MLPAACLNQLLDVFYSCTTTSALSAKQSMTLLEPACYLLLNTVLDYFWVDSLLGIHLCLHFEDLKSVLCAASLCLCLH
jgi:hypothetical protein